MTQRAFQDEVSGNHCWGCGSGNHNGLQIKSYWSGDEAVCTWQPQAHHSAGPGHILNGGIIVTVINCHCVKRPGDVPKYVNNSWMGSWMGALHYDIFQAVTLTHAEVAEDRIPRRYLSHHVKEHSLERKMG